MTVGPLARTIAEETMRQARDAMGMSQEYEAPANKAGAQTSK